MGERESAPPTAASGATKKNWSEKEARYRRELEELRCTASPDANGTLDCVYELGGALFKQDNFVETKVVYSEEACGTSSPSRADVGVEEHVRGDQQALLSNRLAPWPMRQSGSLQQYTIYTETTAIYL